MFVYLKKISFIMGFFYYVDYIYGIKYYLSYSNSTTNTT